MPVLVFRNPFWLIKMTCFRFCNGFHKKEFCKLFANTTLFHIYWYYIGNVRTLIDFMTGFSSPESILADQNDLFSVFVTDFKNGNLYIVGQNLIISIYWN